jgi:hypothetical protein
MNTVVRILHRPCSWTPAFAGVTGEGDAIAYANDFAKSPMMLFS